MPRACSSLLLFADIADMPLMRRHDAMIRRGIMRQAPVRERIRRYAISPLYAPFCLFDLLLLRADAIIRFIIAIICRLCCPCACRGAPTSRDGIHASVLCLYGEGKSDAMAKPCVVD